MGTRARSRLAGRDLAGNVPDRTGSGDGGGQAVGLAFWAKGRLALRSPWKDVVKMFSYMRIRGGLGAIVSGDVPADLLLGLMGQIPVPEAPGA